MTFRREYFKQYRSELGFTTQAGAKEFLGAKDITPDVDLNYVGSLNGRLSEILNKVQSVVSNDIRVDDLDAFKRGNIDAPYEVIQEAGILPRLNNWGRRPEQVYYSWMRGYVFSCYFVKALSLVFEVNISGIRMVGDDDLTNVETFRKTPKADLEVILNEGEKIRIEVQSGFTGINDIKQHKVLEAKSIFREKGIHTVAIHFDLYNGQVAFVKLDNIKDDDAHWITRQQMEGQTVFEISQNSFVWKITEPPVIYENIEFE